MENGPASKLLKGGSKRKSKNKSWRRSSRSRRVFAATSRATLDEKGLKQEHAEMLAFLQNEQNQPKVKQQLGNQRNNDGQIMQFNI